MTQLLAGALWLVLFWKSALLLNWLLDGMLEGALRGWRLACGCPCCSIMDRCDARRCLNLKSLMVSNVTEQAPNLILFAKQNQSLSHPTLVFFQSVCDRALTACHSGVGPAYRAPGTSPLN